MRYLDEETRRQVRRTGSRTLLASATKSLAPSILLRRVPTPHPGLVTFTHSQWATAVPSPVTFVLTSLNVCTLCVVCVGCFCFAAWTQMCDSRLELLEADNFVEDVHDDGNDDAYDIEADLAAATSGPASRSRKTKRAGASTGSGAVDASWALVR